MSGYVKLSGERELFSSGHTLSLVEHGKGFLGYKGEVLFEGVSLLKGKNIDSLSEVGFIEDVRWGSAVEVSGNVYLFCAKQSKADSNPWRYQDIHLYHSKDGINFKSCGKVTEGSAPFIYYDDLQFHLFYHLRNPHRILCRSSNIPFNLSFTPANLILKRDYTISAPSICYFNRSYWLTCERRMEGKDWDTPLFKGKDFNDFKIVKDPLLDARACTFQHLFGKRLILTYSAIRNGVWKIFVREGLV